MACRHRSGFLRPFCGHYADRDAGFAGKGPVGTAESGVGGKEESLTGLRPVLTKFIK